MKLRLLNASHQALCYIGMLLGYEFAHQTMEDADIRKLVELMMDNEVTALLPEVPGVNLADYAKTDPELSVLQIRRFGISSREIGTYGSVGMPKFCFTIHPGTIGTWRSDQAVEFHSGLLVSLLADGKDERGREIMMKDPMAAKLRVLAKAGGQDPRPLLGVREIFSEGLANSPRFVNLLKEILDSFYAKSARSALVNAIK